MATKEQEILFCEELRDSSRTAVTAEEDFDAGQLFDSDPFDKRLIRGDRWFASDEFDLQPGELYLFLAASSDAVDRLLWGVPALHPDADGRLLLETATFDLRSFFFWFPKPNAYKWVRSASRSELRDYFYNLAHCEDTPNGVRAEAL